MAADTILLLHVSSTLAMLGLIWFVQLVHYPLMERVGRAEFRRYERDHQRRTTLVVAPLMLTEAGTALLLPWFRPEGVSLPVCITGLALLAVVWLSTWAWQVPIHQKLEQEYGAGTIRRLVRSNWLRTAAWSARGGVVVWMIASRFPAA